ncbi:hypothetical protein Daesc_006888 [Daldinia eschscholtzii]|uniref:Uncharacterized protein n=1 Tax=Daldinia eschscholtzii TaxID=292717 RepID=A0AAX6MJK0_9PEZI
MSGGEKVIQNPTTKGNVSSQQNRGQQKATGRNDGGQRSGKRSGSITMVSFDPDDDIIKPELKHDEAPQFEFKGFLRSV